MFLLRLVSLLAHRRRYSTKYTAVIVSSGKNSVAVTVSAPPLPYDVKGYPTPRRDLICHVTRILQSQTDASRRYPTDPFIDLSEYIETLTVPMTSSEVSEVLKSIRQPRLAIEFFRFCVSGVPDFKHDAFTYNRMLLILSKSLWTEQDKLDVVRRIVDEMERSGTLGNISTVNILIGIFGGGEELERCMGLVKKWGLIMNGYTYKCILQAYLRSNNLSKALEVYTDMKRRGYKLDIFAWNMLLDSMAKDDKFDQAYKIFDDMKRKHCEPDEYTYTILIRMMGKTGKPAEALALFDEMLVKGISPNLIAYNTMIQALARHRMVDKTIFLFSKMVENECRPNEFTYSLVLNVLVAAGKLAKLDEVVKISSKYMNKGIYAYLVRTLSKLGHASDAHRLFCNMWSFHDKGDRDAYFSMLESLCNAGKVTEALDFLSKVHEKGINTDTMMYNMVFSALGKLKQIPHLCDLYDKMKENGPSPDIFTYNILISSFGRAGRVHEAVKVFEELENSNCEPDIITYNSLINCLGKNGNLDEAHMRFKEMQEKGLNADVITYSTLIECFGKTERVDMACRLFDEMLAYGCCPNIVTYNILLDCLERSGRTAEAVDLYAKLKQQGLTPDSITYAVLERLQSGSSRRVKIRRQSPITGWVVTPLR